MLGVKIMGGEGAERHESDLEELRDAVIVVSTRR